MTQAMALWHTQLTCAGQHPGILSLNIWCGTREIVSLFIMRLLSLTMILCKCSAGYHLGDKYVLAYHLLYLDDLKSLMEEINERFSPWWPR